MAKSFGEPLTKLRAVPIIDNGETLVDPINFSSRIHKAKKHPVLPGDERSILLRETVAKMVATAANSLPTGIDIVIFEGFRPIEVQRSNNEWVRKLMAEKYPHWNKALLQRKINEFSAPADDTCPPPHLTGGAVDLYLINTTTQEMLDVSSPYEPWLTESAETKVKGLTAEALKNRELLIRILTSAGLTNYAGEWWHWSYGDSGWALRTGAEFAVYDRIK